MTHRDRAGDPPGRREATRSWPKALGNRLYGSLSTLLGITSTRGFTGRIPRPYVRDWLISGSITAPERWPLSDDKPTSGVRFVLSSHVKFQTETRPGARLRPFARGPALVPPFRP